MARAAWRQRLWNRADGWVRSILEKPAVLKLRAHPASRYVFYGLLLLIAFLLPLGIGQYWNHTLGTVGIYVLLGLDSNIVVGLAGLLDLGYVAFFAIGAYTVSLPTAPQPHHLLWSFWIPRAAHSVFYSPRWPGSCWVFPRRACAGIISPS